MGLAAHLVSTVPGPFVGSSLLTWRPGFRESTPVALSLSPRTSDCGVFSVLLPGKTSGGETELGLLTLGGEGKTTRPPYGRRHRAEE